MSIASEDRRGYQAANIVAIEGVARRFGVSMLGRARVRIVLVSLFHEVVSFQRGQ